MYFLIVAIAWLYVVLMIALFEAFSTSGTLIGAIVTFLAYGVLPICLVVYLMVMPFKKRRHYLQEKNLEKSTATVPVCEPVESAKDALPK